MLLLPLGAGEGAGEGVGAGAGAGEGVGVGAGFGDGVGVGVGDGAGVGDGDLPEESGAITTGGLSVAEVSDPLPPPQAVRIRARHTLLMARS